MTVDMSKMPVGEWTEEPEQDDFESHGLTCAMRRNHSGSWCGYVGVPPEHPLHGKNYNEKIKVTKDTLERPIDIDKVGVINLFCAAMGDESKDGWIDCVLWFDVHGGLTYSGKGWPSDDGLWYFGFDCSHYGDLSPRNYGNSVFGDGMYRNHEYVHREVENLAAQLSKYQQEPAIAKATGDDQ